jgi:hypothetical protein
MAIGEVDEPVIFSGVCTCFASLILALNKVKDDNPYTAPNF